MGAASSVRTRCFLKHLAERAVLTLALRGQGEGVVDVRGAVAILIGVLAGLSPVLFLHVAP